MDLSLFSLTTFKFFHLLLLASTFFTTSQRREGGEVVVQLELAGSKQLIGKESVMDVVLAWATQPHSTWLF